MKHLPEVINIFRRESISFTAEHSLGSCDCWQKQHVCGFPASCVPAWSAVAVGGGRCLSYCRLHRVDRSLAASSSSKITCRFLRLRLSPGAFLVTSSLTSGGSLFNKTDVSSWYASSLLAFVCLLDLQTYQAHHSLMPTILATPSVQDVVMRHM